MAEVLGVVSSVAAICSCAAVISNYALFNRESDVSAHSGLMSEVTNLGSSLSFFRPLIHTSSEPLVDCHVPAGLLSAASQSENARRKYSTECTADYLRTLTNYFTKDPPPTVFILACIIYTFLYIRLRERQRDDQHQDKIILSGVGIGIAVATYARDWGILKGCVARCAIAAWMLSAMVHWAARLKADRAMTRISEPMEVVNADWKHEFKI
ncbi:hypothetical protein DL98DRAFT_514062 [Cadophora sp. DSE1049]|nr:hypothetical protein DL98DRAFT_514062 [Cadophora sp. DSE1049]